MKNNILILFTCGIISACAHVPLSAKTDKGEEFRGEASGSLLGATFKMVSSGGVTCSGPVTKGPETTKLLNVDCSDGRHGQIVIMLKRDASQKTGTGSGILDDGTKFTFTFGDRTEKKL